MTPEWLVEIHKKLWAKSHLFGQIFRTANLTTTDFIELQFRLDSINPSRSLPSSKAQNVLDIKADFLREKSCAATAEFGNPLNHKLVPSVSLVVPPTSAFKAHPTALPILDDAMDVDAETANCPSYIIAGAKELSTGSTAVLPCVIDTWT